jgi:hypothetical protein
MDLHHKYAVKIKHLWISENENGSFSLVVSEKDAITRENRRGAVALGRQFFKSNWNVTMGDKPELKVVKVRRPLRMWLPW